MSMVRVIAISGFAAWSALAAGIIPGDARRGQQLFESQKCVECHSLNGRGGTLAPDLAKRIDRAYSPAVMASLMWNHAPQMWAMMKREGAPLPRMTPEAAADLFAYFVSARYFEKPGDAGRGKLAFQARRCADCHGISSSPEAAAPPVAKWESLSDPIVLAQQMWNHGAKMKDAFARRNISRPTLTAQELTDMLVYLQNLPETRNLKTNFSFPLSDSGEKLFESKGCSECHVGKLALENRLKNQTLTQIAVAMWEHQPSMKQPSPVFSTEEMRQVLAYVWARQYFSGDGSVSRGIKVFTDKTCATCHNDASSGAPRISRRPDGYSAITMVSVLWEHGPQMLDRMNQRKLAWPRFTSQQMSDLIAYLNSL